MHGPSDNEKKKPTLQTVERALSFMEIVGDHPDEVTVRGVSDQLGLNVTTCYHLFNTLMQRGYVQRNPDNTLRLGNNVATLYEGYRRGFSSQAEMLALVSELSESTQETAYLSLYVNDSVILSSLAEGAQAIRASGLYVGLSGLEHVRSSGQAVLAFLPYEQKNRLLEKSLNVVPPAQRPVLLSRLEDELREVKARGWALDNQGYELGIVGLSAPIFSEVGLPLGAIGIWTPTSRWEANHAEILEKVLDAAKQASRVLGSV